MNPSMCNLRITLQSIDFIITEKFIFCKIQQINLPVYKIHGRFQWFFSFSLRNKQLIHTSPHEQPEKRKWVSPACMWPQSECICIYVFFSSLTHSKWGIQ